jgi:agmatinase
MPQLSANFGGLEEPDNRYDSSRIVVLPVPFERTTSYGKGTASGPQAILEASQYLEHYDEELDSEPYRQGIATLEPILPGTVDPERALVELETEVRRHLEAGKFLVTLGGEHSLSLAPVRACRSVFGQLGVVQFDAHADLRQEYDGTPYSHACVMRRIIEEGVATVALGVRSLSAPEAALIRDRKLPVIWGSELQEAHSLLPGLLDGLPERIYLTFDLDYFDPALVPATGTPEPGGGLWYPTLNLLSMIFQSKEVVAMDLVELAPIGGQPASDFLAAKLVYKCLAYL